MFDEFPGVWLYPLGLTTKWLSIKYLFLPQLILFSLKANA